MLDQVLFDAARHPVCFSFSTKDRVPTTLEAIGALAFEGAFDLLWFDGSATPEGRQLPAMLAPNLACLREIHLDVTGGPDFAIFCALTRMLALGYAYCGLLENDVKLLPGWFDALMGLFEDGGSDGLSVGAATAFSFNKRILYRRPTYGVTLTSGAAMILFTREAASLALHHYRTTTSTDTRNWLLFVSNLDPATLGESPTPPPPDTRVASDLVYETVLQQHGMCVLATLPSHARSLDDETLVGPALGGYGTAPSPHDVEAERSSFAAFADRLRRIRQAVRATGPRAPPYLLLRSLDAWALFMHQLVFMTGSPVRLRGKWRIVWSKFTGPFAFEAFEPASSLAFPLYGQLKGLFTARSADSGIIEIAQGGAVAGELDLFAGQDPREQYFAPLKLASAGPDPVTFTVSARRNSESTGSRCRISALCFGELQPWLPVEPRLDVDAMAARLEEQAAQGFVSF